MNKNWSQDGRVCRDCKKFQTLDNFNIRKNGIPYTLCRPCQADDQRRRAEAKDKCTDTERECKSCLQTLPLDRFPKNNRSHGGYLNLCKPCYSTKVSIQKWGISLDGYTHCEICNEPLERGRNKIAVDHDHACCSGMVKSCGNCVRGVLCARCNIGLGSFRDNPEYLRAAALYLEKSR